MRITKLQTLDEIADCRQTWNQLLLHRNRCTINDDFDWILLLYKYFGDPKNNAFFLLEDHNHLYGLLPMIQKKLYSKGIIPYLLLTEIGTVSGVTDFSSICFCSNGIPVSTALHTIFKPFQQIQFKFIFPELLECLSKELLTLTQFKAQPLQCTKNLYIPLDVKQDWQTFFRQLSKNTRRELVKRFNKLEKTHWDIQHNNIQKSGDLVKIIKPIHISRQHQLGRPSQFENIKFVSFLAELIDCYVQKKMLDYSILYIQEKPVSFTMGFKHRRVYYHWLIGFDPNYEKFSPNKIHHMLLIQRLMKENITEFNFMRGEADYKYKWTNRSIPLYEIKLWNETTIYKRLFSHVKNNRFRSRSK